MHTTEKYKVDRLLLRILKQGWPNSLKRNSRPTWQTNVNTGI